MHLQERARSKLSSRNRWSEETRQVSPPGMCEDRLACGSLSTLAVVRVSLAEHHVLGLPLHLTPNPRVRLEARSGDTQHILRIRDRPRPGQNPSLRMVELSALPLQVRQDLSVVPSLPGERWGSEQQTNRENCNPPHLRFSIDPPVTDVCPVPSSVHPQWPYGDALLAQACDGEAFPGSSGDSCGFESRWRRGA